MRRLLRRGIASPAAQDHRGYWPFQFRAPFWGSNLHQVTRLKLLGCVYLISSLPATLYKLFMFNFKINVIFVKRQRSNFFDFAILFSMREWKSFEFSSKRHGFSLLPINTKPTLRTSCAGFGRGKRNARFAWTQFKISVIFVKRLCTYFFKKL